MKELLNSIRYDKNDIYEKINRLLLHNKRIGIFGAGIYANYLEQKLKKWGVEITFCVADDEYYETTVCEDKELIKLCDLEKQEEAMLIIGFETIVEKEDLLKKKLNEILLHAPAIEIIDFENCYIDWNFIDYPFFLNNYAVFEKTYNLLEDDFSRRIMVEYLNSNISGRAGEFCVLKTDHMHDYEYDIMFTDIQRRDGVIVDCGAYNGKTAVEISEYLKNREVSKKIIALEPDKDNIRLIKEKCECYPNIIPMENGVSSRSEKLYFDVRGGQGGKIVIPEDGEDLSQYISITTINIDTLEGRFGEAIAAILMDVEGSELEALKGAAEVIKKYKPALAVRVYHKRTDLLTIPHFLASLSCNDKYKFYLRNNANSRGILDLTLYAV